MLLRRITQHVKDQNWFAVFVDFVIVVIGVFIGIQVADWNEQQKNKIAAREYRENLITDMELSISRNETQAAQSDQEVSQLDLVLRTLEQCRLEDQERPVFAAGLYNMGKINLPIMVMGTIDELQSTGNFPLIGTSQERRLILETVREHQTIVSIEPQISGRSIPSINYVRSRVRFLFGDYRGMTESIPDEEVVFDFDALCGEPKFLHAVATVREMTIANISLNRRLVDFQTELLETLRGDDASLQNDFSSDVF